MNKADRIAAIHGFIVRSRFVPVNLTWERRRDTSLWRVFSLHTSAQGVALANGNRASETGCLADGWKWEVWEE